MNRSKETRIVTGSGIDLLFVVPQAIGYQLDKGLKAVAITLESCQTYSQ